MKRYPTLLAILFLTAASAPGQWLSQTYPLVSGWNGIWLAGDATHTTVADLFTAYPAVTEVWRWNPNPDEIQFTTTPAVPSPDSEEWTVWKRNDPNEQTLSRMVGNSAYLIRCNSQTSVSIKQRVLPPDATWLISGANFLGFPAASPGTGSAPTFSAYFASFPSASTTVLAPGAQIYRYVGGELGASNPMQINPATERVDATKAYWFQVPTVGDFTAPIEYEVPSNDGLAFGRTLSAITVGVTNRTTTTQTINVSLEASESAPAGQRAVAGPVALTRRVFNSATNSYQETPVQSGFAVTLPASGRANLEFGVDRSAMVRTDAGYASILRIKDAGGLSDVRLPVSAEAATTAGLWGAAVKVTDVVSTVPGVTGTKASQPFPLLYIIHVDSAGTARMVSQAFVGQLTTNGNPLGITVSEDKVLSYNESEIKPSRYVTANLPLARAIAADGSVATGSTAKWLVSIPHNDPTNPFIHTYHPDHDNLDPSFKNPLPSGEESYTVSRSCAFTFTESPPDGSTVTGWGTTVLGGTYSETLSGLNHQPLTVRGTFTMTRISEIGEIDLTPPSN